jgi:hypothetical protein
MLDFNAYLAAQHLTREAVNEALPYATIRPDHSAMTSRRGGIAACLWLSLALRRLADVIEVSTPQRTSSALRASSAHGGCC